MSSIDNTDACSAPQEPSIPSGHRPLLALTPADRPTARRRRRLCPVTAREHSAVAPAPHRAVAATLTVCVATAPIASAPARAVIAPAPSVARATSAAQSRDRLRAQLAAVRAPLRLPSAVAHVRYCTVP